jgi:hypothetical protein
MGAQNPVFGGKKSRKRLRRPFTPDISVNLFKRRAARGQNIGASIGYMSLVMKAEARNGRPAGDVNIRA